MKKSRVLAFLILLSVLSFQAMHEYYVGMTEIEYNAGTNTCEIALKVFTDDLELAVQNHSGVMTFLGTAKEVNNAEALVRAYANKHFHIATEDGTRLSLQFIGRETELDVTWLYMESERIEPLPALLVSNDMFMELYDAQVHIVHFSTGDKKYSTLLRSGKTSDTLGK